jgi:hypothetical protein
MKRGRGKLFANTSFVPLIRPAGRRHGWRPAKKDQQLKKECAANAWANFHKRYLWKLALAATHAASPQLVMEPAGAPDLSKGKYWCFLQNLKITNSGGREWRRRVRHFPALLADAVLQMKCRT